MSLTIGTRVRARSEIAEQDHLFSTTGTVRPATGLGGYDNGVVFDSYEETGAWGFDDDELIVVTD